ILDEACLASRKDAGLDPDGEDLPVPVGLDAHDAAPGGPLDAQGLELLASALQVALHLLRLLEQVPHVSERAAHRSSTILPPNESATRCVKRSVAGFAAATGSAASSATSTFRPSSFDIAADTSRAFRASATRARSSSRRPSNRTTARAP